MKQEHIITGNARVRSDVESERFTKYFAREGLTRKNGSQERSE
jgi:hypothetical protein